MNLDKKCCHPFDYFHEGDVSVCFNAKYREYGIRIFPMDSMDEGYRPIDYCPWCGSKLPSSLRTEWFRQIRALGIDPTTGEVPERYKTDEWYKSVEKK